VKHLAEWIKKMGWKSCGTDRYLSMKVEMRPDDGVMYWAYILIYIDDILCVHDDNDTPLNK
jgi:hypothetical protein